MTKRAKENTSPKSSARGLGDFISSASFWVPEHLCPSAWVEHAPFAFWLTNAHRPRVLVELGTHTGFSYFSFCQAIQQLGIGSKCYAIDTWKGDEHSGFYDEDVFNTVVEYHDSHYSAFSRLVRSTFDDAIDHFENGSIDLLHIDGCHFYESVKHNFESWLPKLSERAVVLFHDTNVRDRNFGVFRLWSEFRDKYPYFEFLHGHGLGVAGIGPQTSERLSALFAATEDDSLRLQIRELYSRLGNGIDDRRVRLERGGPGFRDSLAAWLRWILGLITPPISPAACR